MSGSTSADMARQTETAQDATGQLWKQLDRSRIVMLWAPDSGQHPQPMTHFADKDANAIWFITSADTDLAEAVGSGVQGQMTLATTKQDYHASIRGQMEFVRDDAKLDALWSPFAAAWFENGRDDPNIRLLRFTPQQAAVWASEANAILVGLRLMRANLIEDTPPPDVGVHHILNFEKTA